MCFFFTKVREKLYMEKLFSLNFYSSIAIMDMLECEFIATQWSKWSKIDLVNEPIAILTDMFALGLRFIKCVYCFVLFGFALFYFSMMSSFEVDVSDSAIAWSLLHDLSFLVFVFGLFIQLSVQEPGKGNKN